MKLSWINVCISATVDRLMMIDMMYEETKSDPVVNADK